MRPHARLAWLLAAIGALGVALAVGAIPASLWNSVALLAGVLALLDLVALWREPTPEIRREIPGSLALGAFVQVTLEVRNGIRRRRQVTLYDVHPPDFECEGLPLVADLPGATWSTWTYRARPLVRGDREFGVVHCVARSPFGLWQRRMSAAEPALVRVYPDFDAVSRYALLAMEDRLSDIGVRRRRRRGAGSEFQQLREFRQGDSLRQVDWRATARTRKLISREYQDERDQTVIFLLDTGRRMRAQDGPLAHFDEALNAVLMLGYVALRRGDAVGVATFGGDTRWLAPSKGTAAVSRLLNQLYDVQPSTLPPDYGRAALDLMARHPKHALVILVTNLRDEDNDDMQVAIRTLKRRHAVLVASTRESAVDAAMAGPVNNLRDALRIAASYQYRDSRLRYINSLRANGIACVDVAPDQLSVELVNTYLAMKARGAV